MAGKKVKNEVEGIRNELVNLSEAVWALREHITIHSAAAAANGASTPPHEIAADLETSRDSRGTVVTRGVVRDAAGGREYRWDHEATVEDMLETDDDQASQLLAAIGHRQRLAILKAILGKPATAAELVTALDLGTTGAAYHHLNVLQSADLVTQESRGVFVVQPERVSAIFAIMAGIESAATTCFTNAVIADDTVVGEPDSPEAATESGGKRKKRKAA